MMSTDQPPTTVINEHESAARLAAKAAAKAAAVPLNQPKVDTNTAYDPWAKVGREPTEIVNAELGYQYTYAPTQDYPTDGRMLDEWRNGRAAKGYEPRNGPRCKVPGPEFHPSQPAAEIWRRPQRLADEEQRVRIADMCKRPSFAVHYKAQPTELPSLPTVLRDAMYDFHDRTLPPQERPCAEDIDELCRDLAIHPGGETKRRRRQRA